MDTELVKYPRTMHLPWSPNLQNDDRVIEDLSVLENCEDIVITEKMDGENTTLYRDTAHARSLTSGPHPSRKKIKELWETLHWDIPEGMRICGENLYAKHSIHYKDLDAYFLVFNIWWGNICLSWDDTLEWCDLLGLLTVPVLYRGRWDLRALDSAVQGRIREGFVVRDSGSFILQEFPLRVAKFVRKDHVETDQHWMQAEVVPNELKQ